MCVCTYMCMHCIILYLYIAIYICIGADKPTHQLLRKYVRNEVAGHWYDLGVALLGEESVSKLNNIKANNPGDVEGCCNEMFDHWLEINPEASWDILTVALKEIGQIH